MNHRILKALSYLLIAYCLLLPLETQSEEPEATIKKTTALHETPSQAPEKIEVKPKTHDQEISQRLEDILQATSWFINPKVYVENGVVFLTGETEKNQFKNWAGELAHNTQDVTAIVNKINVIESSLVDSKIIKLELIDLWKKILRSFPTVIFVTVTLLLAWMFARIVYQLVPIILRYKTKMTLPYEVIARTIAIAVFLMGVYFVFEVTELTNMALTLISGTGLLGIILGLAFRDIGENFLASVLLSFQKPFQPDDLIDVVYPPSGYSVTGYVERLTMRATVLVSLDGNQLQIPNATVYKSNIVNHSNKPEHREAFSISVAVDSSISKVMESVLKILLDSKEVLKKPEPQVLVEGLEKERITLGIYYWIDIKECHSSKVKSMIIRLIKEAFQFQGIYQLDYSVEDSLEGFSVKPTDMREEKPESKKEDKDSRSQKVLSSLAYIPDAGTKYLNKIDEKKKTKIEKNNNSN